MSQQQLVAYKRCYYERGLEIERLEAKVALLEAEKAELLKCNEELEALVKPEEEPKKEPVKKGAKK